MADTFYTEGLGGLLKSDGHSTMMKTVSQSLVILLKHCIAHYYIRCERMFYKNSRGLFSGFSRVIQRNNKNMATFVFQADKPALHAAEASLMIRIVILY